MINRETIWIETCMQRRVGIEGSDAHIYILTAIHHYNGLRKEQDKLQLISELQVRIRDEKSSLVAEVSLTPDDMEDLAEYLVQAAQHARELKQMIDDDAAEIAAAAAEALKQAKEAA